MILSICHAAAIAKDKHGRNTGSVLKFSGFIVSSHNP